MASAAVHHKVQIQLPADLAGLSLKHLAHTDLGYMDTASVHNPVRNPATQQLQHIAKSANIPTPSQLKICD